MKKLLLFAAVSLFVGGCVPRWQWVHPTAGEAQFNSDVAVCQSTAIQSVPMQPPPAEVEVSQSINVGNDWSTLLQNSIPKNTHNSQYGNYQSQIIAARDRVFNGCMHERGYYKQRVE